MPVRLTPFHHAGALLHRWLGTGTPSLWAHALSVGVPLCVLHAIFLAPGGSAMGLPWLALYLAGTCAWAGPLLNLRWERGLHTLVDDLADRAAAEGWDSDPLHALVSRHQQAALWLPLLSGATLGALVLWLHPHGPAGLLADDHVVGATAFLLGMIGASGGAGVVGLVLTFRLIAAVTRSGLRWDPFHGDGLGGVRQISTYALGTALMFGVGALAVPHGVQWAEALPQEARVLPFIIVVLYTLFLVGSFLLPTALIGRFATQQKARALSAVGRHLTDATARLCGPRPQVADEEERLYERCQALLALRHEIRSVVAYPLGLWQIVRLLLSAAAPLALFAAEHVLSGLL